MYFVAPPPFFAGAFFFFADALGSFAPALRRLGADESESLADESKVSLKLNAGLFGSSVSCEMMSSLLKLSGFSFGVDATRAGCACFADDVDAAAAAAGAPFSFDSVFLGDDGCGFFTGVAFFADAAFFATSGSSSVGSGAHEYALWMLEARFFFDLALGADVGPALGFASDTGGFGTDPLSDFVGPLPSTFGAAGFASGTGFATDTGFAPPMPAVAGVVAGEGAAIFFGTAWRS